MKAYYQLGSCVFLLLLSSCEQSIDSALNSYNLRELNIIDQKGFYIDSFNQINDFNLTVIQDPLLLKAASLNLENAFDDYTTKFIKSFEFVSDNTIKVIYESKLSITELYFPQLIGSNENRIISADTIGTSVFYDNTLDNIYFYFLHSAKVFKIDSLDIINLEYDFCNSLSLDTCATTFIANNFPKIGDTTLCFIYKAIYKKN